MQHRFTHVAIKTQRNDIGLQEDGIARLAALAIMNADQYSPGVIIAHSYAECIEKVRLEVEANGGVWTIMAPEAIVRPSDNPGCPFSIRRIV